jgi:hypothetical protein
LLVASRETVSAEECKGTTFRMTPFMRSETEPPETPPLFLFLTQCILLSCGPRFARQGTTTCTLHVFCSDRMTY